jgi:hypothetical protein
MLLAASSVLKRRDDTELQYIQKVLSYEPVAYWPLNETSGSTAINAEGTTARDGTYANVTLNHTVFRNGGPAGSWLPANTPSVDIFSTSLRDAINTDEGTMMVWIKVRTAMSWVSDAFYRWIILYRNAENRVAVYKHQSVPSTITSGLYRAGSVTTLPQITLAGKVGQPPSWAQMAITWSKTGDYARLYYNGEQVDQKTELGTWLGALTAARIGNDPAASMPHDGWLAHAAVWASPLSAADIFELSKVPGGTVGFFAVGEEADIATIRASLIGEIWSGGGFPVAGADATDSSVVDPLTTSPSNLLRVDKLTFNMDNNAGTFVMSDEIHVWHPTAATTNNKLAIYCTGHTANFNSLGQDDMIRALVEAGYTVGGVHMPLGSVAEHNTYPVPTASLNYLKFFMEGVARLINELPFSEAYMAGLSGGGWTTALYAAIDERITKSVQISGSLPCYIREGSRDWEQFLPGIADLVDYQDLYVMAASSGREAVQLLITNDTCCFKKSQYDSALVQYAPLVEAQVTATGGGSWSLIWDEATTHAVTAFGRITVLSTFAD